MIKHTRNQLSDHTRSRLDIQEAYLRGYRQALNEQGTIGGGGGGGLQQPFGGLLNNHPRPTIGFGGPPEPPLESSTPPGPAPAGFSWLEMSCANFPALCQHRLCPNMECEPWKAFRKPRWILVPQ